MPTHYSEALWGEKPHRINIQSRVGGDQVLLLLHGLGCSSASFGAIWEHEAFQDYSIYALDWLGFGNSDKPEDFSYRLDEQAHSLERFLDSLEHKSIHLVAHSMGAAIALLLPEIKLSKFETFINAEGVLIGEDCDVSRMVSSVSQEDFEGKIFPSLLNLQNSGELYTFYESTSLTGFHRSAASLVAWADSGRLLQRFKELETRKYYIYGSKNSSKAVLAKLDPIPKISIANSGHFMMNENSEGFLQAISQCLAD